MPQPECSRSCWNYFQAETIRDARKLPHHTGNKNSAGGQQVGSGVDRHGWGTQYLQVGLEGLGDPWAPEDHVAPVREKNEKGTYSTT